MYPRSKIDEISKYTYRGHFGYCYNNKKHGFSTYVLIKMDYPKPCRRKIPFKGTPKFSSWGSYSSIRQIMKLNFAQKILSFPIVPTLYNFHRNISTLYHTSHTPNKYNCYYNNNNLCVSFLYICISNIYYITVNYFRRISNSYFLRYIDKKIGYFLYNNLF